MIADRCAFFVLLMLGENTAEVRHAGFGGAVRLFSLASGQLLPAHGHAGGISADVELGCGFGFWQRLPGLALLPSLGVPANELHQALDLPGRELNPARLAQVVFGLLVAAFIGPF